MNVHEMIGRIDSRSRFLEFIDALIQDYKYNQEEWDSKNLEKYKVGMRDWIRETDGRYLNESSLVKDDVNWKFMAMAMLAAKYHE